MVQKMKRRTGAMVRSPVVNGPMSSKIPGSMDSKTNAIGGVLTNNVHRDGFKSKAVARSCLHCLRIVLAQGIQVRQLCSTQPAVFEAVDMPTKNRSKHKVWKEVVPTEYEIDVLEAWVGQRQTCEKVGRWPISEIKYVDKIKDVHDKRDGLLVLCAKCKWNLYFSLDDSFFFFEVLRSGIAAHPLTAIGRIEPAKEIGHLVDERWIPHDQLSYSNNGFRCRRNFSLLAGYSKHGDGKPNKRLT